MAQTVKRLPAMGETGFNSWVGKIPWRRKWQSTPAFFPGKAHGQRSLIGYSPWGHKELDTTERLHFHFYCLASSNEIRFRTDERESQWTPGVGDDQGGLACCDSWDRKELDTAEWLIWSDLNVTDSVRWNFDERGWHHLIAVLPLLLGDNQISCATPCAITGNTEHHPEHSPDEKLNQKVLKPLDELQLIMNIRDGFTFQLKTQSTKTNMLTILQCRKMVPFLYQLNDMTHSHKRECIWLSSNEVDELRAFNTEWNKSEREQISYINT